MGQPGRTVCFGEVLLRLAAPDRELLFQSARLEARFAGAEANMAVALAKLGRAAALVTVVPDDAVGDAVVASVRMHGVDVSGVSRGEGRLGLYYLTPGAGLRAPSIIYDRADSLFARARPEDFDWPALLVGASWLHLSGVIPALGPDAVKLGLAAIEAARAAGVRISFDGNFRPSLWAEWCDDPGAILSEYVEQADLLFGSHRDVALLLGRPFDGDEPDGRREAALAAFGRFPRLTHIASTTRQALSAGHHRLSARVDEREAWHETAALDITDIVDRIGTGDAFAAGVLAGLDDGPEAAASLGLAVAALKHATPGDFSQATQRDIAAFRSGGLDVRR
ncbi:sugar kinase [Sphingomonas jatrophae]|uniref:2-dehydro-3-deoxygluconokinase n=1 Tax=Sphingomonas jatrophae TaxID=1166337 RepID=A0A1I6K1S5_9SPHN|nr:sugar kinase [Sphingomonas jatrophae]SFR85205.1 2-dehydro-3-deoxygluconokinase [Sphingomonas jatrophae]